MKEPERFGSFMVTSGNNALSIVPYTLHTPPRMILTNYCQKGIIKTGKVVQDMNDDEKRYEAVYLVFTCAFQI